MLIVVERAQTYSFDNIFPEDADQEKVYNDAVKPFVDCVKKGYNCTVFAYGQTGTGKTYTMGSGSQVNVFQILILEENRKYCFFRRVMIIITLE